MIFEVWRTRPEEFPYSIWSTKEKIPLGAKGMNDMNYQSCVQGFP